MKKLATMLCAVLLAVTIIMAGLAFAEKTTGWVDNGSNRYLYSTTGKKVSGWYQEGNDWYYLGSQGRMAVGWFRMAAGIYHAAEDGKIDEGWQRFRNIWYTLRQVNIGTEEEPVIILRWFYVDGSEEMPFGQKTLAGHVYNVQNTKGPLSGWNEQEGAKAYFNEDGTADVGWIKVGEDYFYLDLTARLAQGNRFIDGEYFALTGKGALKDETKVVEVEAKIASRTEPVASAANSNEKADEAPVPENIDKNVEAEVIAPAEKEAEIKADETIADVSVPVNPQEVNEEEKKAEKADAAVTETANNNPAPDPESKPAETSETVLPEKAEANPAEKTDTVVPEKANSNPVSNQETKPAETANEKDKQNETASAEKEAEIKADETIADVSVPVNPQKVSEEEKKAEANPAEKTDTVIPEKANSNPVSNQETKPAETANEKDKQNETASAENQDTNQPEKQPDPVVTTEVENVEEAIPYETEYLNDTTRFPEDGNKTIQAGKDGVKVICYIVTYTDGEETSRKKTGEYVKTDAILEVISIPSKKHVVEVKEETTTEDIAFETETREDSTRDKGEADQVIQEGVKGVKTYVYTVTYTDGTETDRTLKSESVTKEPVKKIVSVATGAKTVTSYETVTEEIPYTSSTKEYNFMYKGETDVVQEGINGSKTVKYKIVKDEQGNEISRTAESETITKAMQPEIIGVGTFEPTYTITVVSIDPPGMHGTRSASLDAECVAWAKAMANKKKVEHSGPIGTESVGGWGSASEAASGVATHGGEKATALQWSEYWGAGCVALSQTRPGGGTNTVYFACARGSGGFLEGTPIDNNNE